MRDGLGKLRGDWEGIGCGRGCRKLSKLHCVLTAVSSPYSAACKVPFGVV
jgi:hypothetical protein